MSTNHGHGHGHGEEGVSEESVKLGFEPTDWQFRPVWVLTIATLAILAFTYIAMGGLIFVTGGSVADASNTIAPTGETRLPPEPRLEQNPTRDGTRIETEALERLETYGWADDAQTAAHIPIDRAMEILLERGVANAFAGEGGAAAAPAPAERPADAPPIEFDAALAAQGEQIFTNLGCANCHRGDGAGIGPSLEGRYGRERPLADGSTVLVDEAYVSESILNSTAKVAEGYQPIMPPYQGQLDDDQVAQLIEYIKSLGE
jgi:mono/diheme cytochrome c family protein